MKKGIVASISAVVTNQIELTIKGLRETKVKVDALLYKDISPEQTVIVIVIFG